MLAELRDSGQYFAIKALKKDVVLEGDNLNCTIVERRVLQIGGQHPHLTHLHATFQSKVKYENLFLLHVSTVSPPCLLRVSTVSTPCLLRVSSVSPPCLLRVSSMSPPCLHRVSSVSPPCLLRVSSMSPLCLLRGLKQHFD